MGEWAVPPQSSDQTLSLFTSYPLILATQSSLGKVNANQCSAVLLLEEGGSEREDLHLACWPPHENTGTSCERMCCVYAEVFLLLARAAMLSVCLNHKLNLIFLKKQGQ